MLSSVAAGLLALASTQPLGRDATGLQRAERADAVLVGTLSGTSTCGGASLSHGRLEPHPVIQVLRSLKGDLAPGDEITSFLPMPETVTTETKGQRPGGNAGVPAGVWATKGVFSGKDYLGGAHGPICTGLFFLVRVEDGWSTLANGLLFLDGDVFPLPEESPSGEWSYGRGDALVDKLVKELRAALETNNAEILSAAGQLLGSFERSVRIRGPYDNRETTADSETGTLLRRHLAGHARSRCALAETLDSWQQVAMDRLAEFAQTSSPDGSLPPGLVGLLYDVSDPRTLPALGRLLSSKEKAPHRGGHDALIARALWNIRTEETLPLLLRLLDSPNIDARSRAIWGFTLVALRCRPGVDLPSQDDCAEKRGSRVYEEIQGHGPSLRPSPEDEAKFIAFWKDWYGARRPSN